MFMGARREQGALLRIELDEQGHPFQRKWPRRTDAILLRRRIQTAPLGPSFVAGVYCLYRETWTDGDKEMLALFMPAFGLDLTAYSVAGAFKAWHRNGPRCVFVRARFDVGLDGVHAAGWAEDVTDKLPVTKGGSWP